MPAMARLVGVDLPRDKRLEIALTYIYGIGRTRAQEILQATGVSPDLRVHQLTDQELVPMRDYIEANFKIEGDLRREVQADIRRKEEIGCYEGIRHRKGLPVRGQRTRANARTRKGPKRTVAGKKKPGEKEDPPGASPPHTPRRGVAVRSASGGPAGTTDHEPAARQSDITERTRLCHRRLEPDPRPPRRSAARNARTSRTDRRTSRAPSTTRSSRSPTRPVPWSRGPRPARSAS